MLFTSTKRTIEVLLFTITAVCALSFSCTGGTPDVKIYTFPSPQENPSATAVPGQQTAPPLTLTIPSGTNPKEEYFERNVVVTRQNNYFPIAAWAGYTEKTELIAEQPVDVSFGDVSENLMLEINGIIVQHSYRWETKIGARTGITSLNYRVSNNTTQDYSYTLYITPSQTVNQVKVTVKQRFMPKQ